MLTFEVTWDYTVKTVKTMRELWTALYLDPVELTDCCAGIIMRLLNFGELDLSAAYFGHYVKIRLVNKNEQEDE